MKLLLDEMYAPRIAEQLRARGHDVALVHDPADRRLEGVPDDEAWASAVADGRALVSENVQDFRRIPRMAISSERPVHWGAETPPDPASTLFLKPSGSSSIDSIVARPRTFEQPAPRRAGRRLAAEAHRPDGTTAQLQVSRQLLIVHPILQAERRFGGAPSHRESPWATGEWPASEGFVRPEWGAEWVLGCIVGDCGIVWATHANPGGRAPPTQPPGF